MLVRKMVLVLAAVALLAFVAGCGGGGGGGSKDSANAPEAPAGPQPGSDPAKEEAPGSTTAPVPADTTLTLTVPGMARIKDDKIPTTTGNDEPALKSHAGVHLKGTGFPWDREANVYIAGHRLGYPNTDSFLAFWDLDALKKGDPVTVKDANGREYRYEVTREFDVSPTDLHVLDPIKGKNVLTLQTCTLPDYSRRLIVQAELKG